jgi:hypothetical protein
MVKTNVDPLSLVVDSADSTVSPVQRSPCRGPDDVSRSGNLRMELRMELRMPDCEYEDKISHRIHVCYIW